MNDPAPALQGSVTGGARREALRARLAALGFDEVRFVSASSVGGDGLREWIARGNHADMDWIPRTAAKRLDPALVLPGTATIVALGVNYWRRFPVPGAAAPVWARYAQYADYHDTLRPALAEAGRAIEEACGIGSGDHRYYVDTGPVLERTWAARGGVGFIGKNAMLISRTHGNWLFLAAILVRARIEPDGTPIFAAGRAAGAIGSLCGTCTRCLDACPTDAFQSPGVLDARRCISYQTIENKGVIPRELRPGIGLRIYGCDICLEVCPWNRFAREGRELILSGRDGIAALSLREILALTPQRFAEVFRGTPVKRLRLQGLLRNACVVSGNTGDPSLASAVRPLAEHPSAIVRAHAVWSIRRLAGADAAGLLETARAAEADGTVLEEYRAETVPRVI